MAAARRLWHFPPMTDDLPLAAEFPPTSAAAWRKLVEAALKGAPFDKRLVSQTYDGLRIEPLYPRAAGAKPVPGRKPGAAWSVMQRVDHPDPAAANAQALHDLENGATGLTLVFAGSRQRQRLRPRRLAADAGARSRRRRARCHHRRLQSEPADARGRAAFRGAGDGARPRARSRSTCAPASIRSAASPPPARSPLPWSALSQRFAAMVGALAEQGFRGPFAVADGRVIHNAGGSEAQELAFALASRGRLSARAGSRRRRARCRARHDLFPARGRCRRVPHHRQIPRVAETVGARRSRPAGWRRSRPMSRPRPPGA